MKVKLISSNKSKSRPFFSWSGNSWFPGHLTIKSNRRPLTMLIIIGRSTTGHSPCASCRTPASSPWKLRFLDRRARGSTEIALLGSIPADPNEIKKRISEGSVFLFHGGSDGNRTHVRKHFHRSFSERSFCFKVSPQTSPKSRLYHQLSR